MRQWPTNWADGGAAPKPPPLAAEAFGGNGSALRLASPHEPHSP